MVERTREQLCDEVLSLRNELRELHGEINRLKTTMDGTPPEYIGMGTWKLVIGALEEMLK